MRNPIVRQHNEASNHNIIRGNAMANHKHTGSLFFRKYHFRLTNIAKVVKS